VVFFFAQNGDKKSYMQPKPKNYGVVYFVAVI